jgi:hypothetical protein
MFYKAYFGNDEHARYFLAEKAANLFYPKYKFGEFGCSWRDDSDFVAWYERYFGRCDYHSLDRKYTLQQFAKLTSLVSGDTVECGAYTGASSYLICDCIRDSKKSHHIFDSFEGLSEPSEPFDGNYWRGGDLRSTEEECRAVLREFDYVKYYKGWIPSRFNEVMDRRFSFVHVDVDLYQPTLDSITFFWPRLSRNGILICDDYGFNSCPGARKAVDEYFKNKATVLMMTTGQGVVIKSDNS